MGGLTPGWDEPTVPLELEIPGHPPFKLDDDARLAFDIQPIITRAVDEMLERVRDAEEEAIAGELTALGWATPAARRKLEDEIARKTARIDELTAFVAHQQREFQGFADEQRDPGEL